MIKEEIIAEIRNAIKKLGYTKESDVLLIKSIDEYRHEVYINSKYFGIWDSERKTFVD